MPRLKVLVFDLDGTLVDSRQDLAASVNAVLDSMRLPSLDPDRIASFVGDGAEDLVIRSLQAAGLSAPEAASRLPETLRAFLDHYADHCLDRTVPFAGAAELLRETGSYRKALLTNKPMAQTRRILEGLGLQSHFELVLAGDGPLPKKPDPAGLGYILSALEATATEAVLIGDSMQDLRTARAGGCAFMAFLGGMGDAEAVRAAGPDAVVESLEQVRAALAELETRLVHG